MDQRHALAYAIIAILVVAAVLMVFRVRFNKRRARREDNRPIRLTRRK